MFEQEVSKFFHGILKQLSQNKQEEMFVNHLELLISYFAWEPE